MNGMWSSSRPKGWPRHGFQKRGGAIFFGLVATFAAWFVQWQYQWDGMQRYYLAHYVVSSAGLFQKYLVLHTVDRCNRSCATRCMVSGIRLLPTLSSICGRTPTT